MANNGSSILILKPVSYFLSFIAAQLPFIELPDLKKIQLDNTAYSIGLCNDDDSILKELERLYPLMLVHEVSRLVGEELSLNISGSFLDFLCCFKFELNSHVMLMESCFDDGHQVLCIKPRLVDLKFNENSFYKHDDVTKLLAKMNLSHCSDNATVLVKNFDQINEVTSFIKKYYQPIFNSEMIRMSENAEKWPSLDSEKIFSRYFSVEIHTKLVHLH